MEAQKANVESSPEERALLERIEQARGRRRELAATVLRETRLRDLTEQAEREELELSREQLATQFEKEHGRRGVKWDFVACRRAVVAVRAPHFLTWQQYRDAGMPSDTKGIRELLFRSKGQGSCLIAPETQQAFHELEQEEPGLLDLASVVVARLASASHVEQSGK